jgi:DNA-binding response OmpR family regulator
MNESQIPATRESEGIPPQTRNSPPQHILVVDDDRCIRQLNTEVLLCSGYEVDAAEDGAAAWDILQLKGYDLLITDNEMPKVSGIELVKRLHAARMDLPVIMATGTPPKAEFARCPWLKPAATLIKPYTFDELLVAVREVLSVTDAAPGQNAPRPDWRSQPSAGRLRL